jgi:hypothetical protein
MSTKSSSKGGKGRRRRRSIVELAAIERRALAMW